MMVWTAKWISDDLLRAPFNPNQTLNVMLKVFDLIDPKVSSWKQDLIGDVWRLTKNGHYSVKSGDDMASSQVCVSSGYDHVIQL